MKLPLEWCALEWLDSLGVLPSLPAASGLLLELIKGTSIYTRPSLATLQKLGDFLLGLRI